jgi:hypothetical protein
MLTFELVDLGCGLVELVGGGVTWVKGVTREEAIQHAEMLLADAVDEMDETGRALREAECAREEACDAFAEMSRAVRALHDAEAARREREAAQLDWRRLT